MGIKSYRVETALSKEDFLFMSEFCRSHDITRGEALRRFLKTYRENAISEEKLLKVIKKLQFETIKTQALVFHFFRSTSTDFDNEIFNKIFLRMLERSEIS